MIDETNAINSGTLKIISAAVPDCLVFPLTAKCRPTWEMSAIRDLGMNGLCDVSAGESNTNLAGGIWSHPTGQNVSNPFAVVHGNPLALTASCTFLAVISTASATWYELRAKRMLGTAHYILRYGHPHRIS